MRGKAVRYLTGLWLAAGCASVAGEAGPSLPADRPAELRRSTPAPEAASLLAEFYGPGFDPAWFTPKLEAALAAHPDDADLQEMAIYLAALRGDDEATELHELLALLDERCAAPLLWIHSLPFDQPGALAVIRELAEHAPDPELSGKAHRLLLWAAVDRGDEADAAHERQALGILTRFSVIGPFDNEDGKGFATRYPPEERVDLGAAYPGLVRPVHWQKVESPGNRGEVPLPGMLWPNEGAVAYSATWLTVPAAADATLWIGTRGPIEVFLDGRLALAHERLDNEGRAFDDLGLRVHLAEGPHELLFKSAPKSKQGFMLVARLVGPDGKPLPGLVEAAEPSPSLVAASSFEPIPLVHGLRADVAGARSHLLSARIAALVVGDAQLEMREASAFADAAKSNPLALWAMARAAEDGDEQGRELDALDEAVRRFGEQLPGFYDLRARAYLRKELLEKAQEDAETFLRLRPHDLRAQLLLAWVQGRRKLNVERCRALSAAVADHPRKLEPLRELARCRTDEGLLGEARALLERARDLAPGEWETLRQLADVDRQARRLSEAADIAASLRERWSSLPGVWDLSARVAIDAGDENGAEAFLREAHRRSPDEPGPLARLAEMAALRGRRAEAEALWAKASERDPGNELYAERAGTLTPTTLGFAQKYVPDEAAVRAAIAEGAKRLPREGSQSILLLDDEVTEVHADGSSTHLVTQVERVVNDPGRDRLLAFGLPRGVVKVLDAYVVSADGKREEASSIRKPTIHFRELEVGSTRVVRFIWHARGGHFLPNQFFQDWSFQSPTREHALSHWTLIMPKGRPLHVSVHGGVQATSSEEQGRTIYQFTAKDVPPLVAEPHAPPLGDLLWRAAVSTVPSWDDYVAWERALLVDAFQPSDELAALARKLTAGAATPREKLDRLTRYVAEEIRYQMDYEKPIAGVRPHSARQVLERRYADCKDKAVLLIALGREVGLHLDFALVRTQPMGRIERDVPNQQFNHAIVYAPAQPGLPEPRFVDATTNGLDVGNLRIDDQGTSSLVIDPAAATGWRFIDIPYRAPEEETARNHLDVALAADGGATVAQHLELRGFAAAALRRILKTRAEGHKVEEQIASLYFPGAAVASASAGDPADVTRPFTLDLSYAAPNALETEGRVQRLHLRAAADLEGLTALATRELPLWLGSAHAEEWSYSVRLPPGSRVQNLPESFREDAKCLSIERLAQQKGDELEVHIREVKSCPEVSPAEYPAFRVRVLAARNLLEERIAFTGSTAQAAPAR